MDTLKKAFQVSDNDNPLVGTEGRCQLLNRLGAALSKYDTFYLRNGVARPGNMVDFLIVHPSTGHENSRHQVQMATLWSTIIQGM